ncbi:MAG: hypothetical protein PHY08_14375, partial [Candidatus Cloacimonetes bacterium]|nr:hypothetical protein [Candidatus Cloacimonadota bacterium]
NYPFSSSVLVSKDYRGTTTISRTAYAVGSLPAHMDFTAYNNFYGLAQSIQKQKEPILRSVLSSYQLKIIKDLHNQSY